MSGATESPQRMSSSHEPSAQVVGRIRRSLRELLVGWAVDADTIDDTLLVVEELVANVVAHARTRFRLTVALTGPLLRVAVRDGSERLPELRPLDPRSPRGRGLQLIKSLTLRWGYELHTAASDQWHGRGKTVWAELTI